MDGTVAQRDEAWFKASTAEEKVEAYHRGELQELLASVGPDGPYSAHGRALSPLPRYSSQRNELQRDQAWVDRATAEELVDAERAGELDDWLGRG